MQVYTFTKTPLALDSLDQEIRTSPITVALESLTALDSELSVTFKDTLSVDEEGLLAAIVSAHAGLPLPQNTSAFVAVTSLPDPAPFAQPSYRTKRDAGASPVSCAPGAIANINLKLVEERYVSGGSLIIENAEFGDYVMAYVLDSDGVIPSAYRAELCEAHPIVATYIEKEFVKVGVPGSLQPGSISVVEIDTSPLNAKITAGLCLCIEYRAVSSGLTRRVAVNYHLTKKL